jgi:hypothetical protein
MGQYHHPVCIEAEEGLSPHTLGCGLKEGEQGFTRPGTPNAIVALVCARGGNMPADCSQSPLIGRWAGKRVLVQGDYAEDGDIANWDGPPLSALYRAMRRLDDREPWDGMPKGYWDVSVFADISAEACAFLEAACNVRYFEQKHQIENQKGKIVDTYASTHFVKVKPTGKHFGGCGVAEYVIDDSYTVDDLAWLKTAMRSAADRHPARTALGRLAWHPAGRDFRRPAPRDRQPRQPRIHRPRQIRPKADLGRHARRSRPAAVAEAFRKGRPARRQLHRRCRRALRDAVPLQAAWRR